MNTRRWIRVVAAVLGTLGVCAHAQQIDFGDVAYKKLATRAQTEQYMTAALTGRMQIDWSDWYLLGPFEGNDDPGQIARVLLPEAELLAMRAGGPGPDLAKTYEGKMGQTIGWKDIGSITDRKIDLKQFGSDELNTQGIAYLYRSFVVKKGGSLRVTMGSDDGLRFWLNGRLLVDADAKRGLNPFEHSVVLELKPGVNHILCKVTQGVGGWDYQLNTTMTLDAYLDAKLQAALNRDFPTPEQAFYTMQTVPVPDDIKLEVGGLAMIEDGRVAVSTRRGDVYFVAYRKENGASVFAPRYTRFASGMHEALGLAARIENDQQVLYAVQRGELTRLIDQNNDDQADIYESFCHQWGISGNYHEFSFGPKFDAQGNAWVAFNVGFCGSLGKSIALWRGWIAKITPEGKLIPVCDGVRSPNGIGVLPNGQVFYVDNQGDYVGTNRMNLVATDLWQGHPSSNHWRKKLPDFTQKPTRQKATIWLPYKKMGQSTADIVVDQTGGKFGPFAGQIFVGDQTLATVMRIDLEQVDGVWQGACFPFREGLDCGVNRIVFDKDGSMIVGETDRGWGSVGRRRYGIQRIAWTGKTPFEMRTMRVFADATSQGFTLHFTEDLDPKTATDPASYTMSSYTYEYHKEYGSDEMQTEHPTITRVQLVEPRTVKLTVTGLRSGGEGFVHELHADGVRSASGHGLLHKVGYYTLQRLPETRSAGRVH